METILILTNHSKKAQNAALYAFKLAESTKANIILYHSTSLTKTASVRPAEMVSFDDYVLQENGVGLSELKEFAVMLEKNRCSDKFKPAIQILNDTGDFGQNINKVIWDNNVDLIVMGAKSDDAISHHLFGSETNKVLESADCPVLFIPDGCTYSKIKTIVFSNDLKNTYNRAVGFLTDLARVDRAEIMVSHVGDIENDNHLQCLNIIKNVFKYPNASFRQIPGEIVQDKLRELIFSLKADLLAMIYHKHLLYGKPIPGSNSKKMLYNQSIPLLILPE